MLLAQKRQVYPEAGRVVIQVDDLPAFLETDLFGII